MVGLIKLSVILQSVIWLSLIMISIIMLNVYAQYNYAVGHNADSLYGERDIACFMLLCKV